MRSLIAIIGGVAISAVFANCTRSQPQTVPSSSLGPVPGQSASIPGDPSRPEVSPESPESPEVSPPVPETPLDPPPLTDAGVAPQTSDDVPADAAPKTPPPPVPGDGSVDDLVP